MKEHTWMRSAILVFWTLFWGLSVVDKIIPDVQHLWVGKDFFALFVKFFASLGLKDPLFPDGRPCRGVGTGGFELHDVRCRAVGIVARAECTS